MKLLISGTTGFIGKHLVNRLRNEGHEIIGIVRPVSKTSKQAGVTSYVFDGDGKALAEFLKEQRIDGVIHLASLFLAQHTAEDIPNLIDSNIRFATSLLEASTQARVPWFINTGTFWQHYQNQRYSPVNLYAATKQAFEDIAQYYTATTPLRFVTIKLCDTFGPDDTRVKIFNLWKKISVSGETLDMSPGEQIIDISYIDNVIDAYLRLVTVVSGNQAGAVAGKVFAVKSNERMSLRALAGVFEEVTQTKLHINWGAKEYRPREVMIPWEDGETIPGWCPVISLREGIQRMFHERS